MSSLHKQIPIDKTFEEIYVVKVGFDSDVHFDSPLPQVKEK